MRKILRFAFVLILLLVAAVFLLPILFKDEIFQLVKDESKNHIKGEVVIEDMGLSLFSDFPNLTLSLEGFALIGEGDFEDISLVSSEEISVEIDLFSAIGGNSLEIESIRINDAELYVMILPDGTANYDIVRETEETDTTEEESAGSQAYSLKLKDFRLDNVNVVYDDRQGDMYANLTGINHRLSGDFSETIVAMKTETSIESMDVAMDGTSYFRKTKAAADINLTYHSETGQLKLDDNSIRLNDLVLNGEGNVVLGDVMDLNMKFNAPSTDFREVLSLIPEVYYNDFSSVETSGSFAFDGFVKGTLDESDNLPAFGINLKVSNASFSYPELPAGAEKLNVEVHVSKPVGTADETVVDIPQLSGLLAGQPVEARMKLSHPISDPEIDLYARTDLDLAKVEKMVPQEGLSYEGRVKTDLTVKGKMSDFENQNLDAVEVGGNLLLSKFRANTTSFGLPFELDTMAMTWKPQSVNVPVLNGKMGHSDFSGSGMVDNMMSFILSDTTLRGRFRLNSELLDLNELAGAVPESEESEVETPDTTQLSAVRIPMNLDMDIRAEVKKVLYDDMELTDTRGQLTLVDGVAALSGFRMNTLGGSIGMDGSYDSKPAQPEVLFDFELSNLDIGEAFSHIDMLKSYAPIAESATGKLSTTFDLNALLKEDMTPDLNTVAARGVLQTAGLKVEPQIMQKVATTLNNAEYGRLLIGNSNLSFSIQDGRLSVQPFKVKLGGQEATVSGSSGLDQSLDYTMTTKLPISGIRVPAEVSQLGITGDIDVRIKFGGTVDDPSISTNFGDITAGIENQIRDVIQNQIDETRDEVINRVNEEAERIMEQARIEAQRIKDEAKRQADRVRTEAANAARKLKDEAKQQGDKLVAEAGSNPLAKRAAQAAAERLMTEAEGKGQQLINEAERRAQQIENEANQRADAVISDAESRAKIEN